jgi:hypothetical protein
LASRPVFAPGKFDPASVLAGGPFSGRGRNFVEHAELNQVIDGRGEPSPDEKSREAEGNAGDVRGRQVGER